MIRPPWPRGDSRGVRFLRVPPPPSIPPWEGGKVFFGRGGFTVIELLVSVAVLVGIMTMVAMIFATASKASGQAAASSTLYRYLRQATDALRADLAAVDPSTSVLFIGGTEIQAYKTEQARTSGQAMVSHRADVLSFLTKRSVQPFVFEQPAPPTGPIPLADRVLVTYGHADWAPLVSSGKTDNPWAFDLSKLIRVEGEDPANPVSPKPASQWHLARRIIAFPAATYAVSQGSGMGDPGDLGFTTDKFLTGDCDVFGDPLTSVLPHLPPGFYHFNDAGGMQYVYCRYSAGTDHWYRSPAAGVWYVLYDDGYWYQFEGSYVPNPDHWVRWENGAMLPPILLPYPSRPSDDPTYSNYITNVVNWFHVANPTAGHPGRVVVPSSLPVGAQKRLGSYFLPGCSEFRVEYTYDDPREILLDASDAPIFQHPVRWYTVGTGEQMIWSQLAADPTDRTDPHRWPKALRITIRVYDQGGRLEAPIEQTVIHTW